MLHKEGDYGGLEQPTEPERARLRLLAAGPDPLTRRWLREIGVPRGARCLEVGAAQGSMSRWLAEQVGPEGRVVAADIDVRFLDDMDLPNVEVRRLDLRSDAPERGVFDLAYCRTLPRVFRALGLVDVRADATAQLIAGKSPIAEQLFMTQGILGPRLVAAGAVTQAELDAALRCYADPGFEFLQGLQFAVWGRDAA